MNLEFDFFLPKINDVLYMDNAIRVAFVDVEDPKHPNLAHSFLNALISDMTRDRDHFVVYLLQSEWGISMCLSITLYKLCDFSFYFGSSPIRANTSRKLGNSHTVSYILFRKIIIINFKTCYISG